MNYKPLTDDDIAREADVPTLAQISFAQARVEAASPLHAALLASDEVGDTEGTDE